MKTSAAGWIFSHPPPHNNNNNSIKNNGNNTNNNTFKNICLLPLILSDGLDSLEPQQTDFFQELEQVPEKLLLKFLKKFALTVNAKLTTAVAQGVEFCPIGWVQSPSRIKAFSAKIITALA